jgi:hypothetical protein
MTGYGRWLRTGTGKGNNGIIPHACIKITFSTADEVIFTFLNAHFSYKKEREKSTL